MVGVEVLKLVGLNLASPCSSRGKVLSCAVLHIGNVLAGILPNVGAIKSGSALGIGLVGALPCDVSSSVQGNVTQCACCLHSVPRQSVEVPDLLLQTLRSQALTESR